MSGHWINARDTDDLMPRVCTIVLFLRLSVSGLAHRAGHSFVGIARNCYHTPYAIVIAHKIIHNHNHVYVRSHAQDPTVCKILKQLLMLTIRMVKLKRDI